MTGGVVPSACALDGREGRSQDVRDERARLHVRRRRRTAFPFQTTPPAVQPYLKRERKVLGEYEVVGAVDGLGERSGVDGAL